jgi:hypothetical protein
MNYWKEKIDFWENKTKDNKIYQSKNREIIADVIKIIRKNEIDQVIDVCGYKGELEKLLRFFGFKGRYINIDFRTDVDVTLSWDKQLSVPIDKTKKTLSICSLSLMCIPSEEILNVMYEIDIHAKYQYYLEQDFIKGKEHAEKLNDQFGGKWNYDWSIFFPKIKIETSKVNKSWVKFYREI